MSLLSIGYTTVRSILHLQLSLEAQQVPCFFHNLRVTSFRQELDSVLNGTVRHVPLCINPKFLLHYASDDLPTPFVDIHAVAHHHFKHCLSIPPTSGAFFLSSIYSEDTCLE